MDKESIKYARQREEMVRSQIEARGIKSPRVLAAFRRVPRHLFVSEALRDQAYGDYPLPIGEQQTISQPFIVAEMTQALDLCEDCRYFQCDNGLCYEAAILAKNVYRVYTIERKHSLYLQTRNLFDKLHYHNIVMKYADGTKGWQDESPFDGIIVTAGAPQIPDVLIDQLGEGGRLVVPVGNQHTQELIKIFRDGQNIRQTNLGGCRFVKLVGKHGWKDA